MTSLQWLMVILVIHQDIHATFYAEIVRVTRKGKPAEENDLLQMPYLEVVVKETLRLHPPGHFILIHVVTCPCKLAGYNFLADVFVNFYVASIGMDLAMWRNPSKFKLERFSDQGMKVDLTRMK